MTFVLSGHLLQKYNIINTISVTGHSASMDVQGQIADTGGITVQAGANFALNVYAGSQLTEASQISIGTGAYMSIDNQVSSGTFVNNGSINVGDGILNLGGKNVGSGIINITGGGDVHVSGSFAATGTPTQYQPLGTVETININSGMLQIDHPMNFMAKVNIGGSGAYLNLKNTSVSSLLISSHQGQSTLVGFNAAGAVTASIPMGFNLADGDPTFAVHMSGNDAIITHPGGINNGVGGSPYTPYVMPTLHG